MTTGGVVVLPTQVRALGKYNSVRDLQLLSGGPHDACVVNGICW